MEDFIYADKLTQKVPLSMGRQLAITDVHGCHATFLDLLQKVGLTKSDQLFLLGDYIHRGPDSVGVINTILKLQEEGYSLQLLRGNHEMIFLKDVFTIEYAHLKQKLWEPKMISLLTQEGELAAPYDSFFFELNYYLETEAAFLVHAAFDTTGTAPFENHKAMLWERSMEYNSALFSGKKVIHGHTPTALTEIERNINSGNPIINLDNGCVFPDRAGMGNLCCLDIGNMQLYHSPHRG